MKKTTTPLAKSISKTVAKATTTPKLPKQSAPKVSTSSMEGMDAPVKGQKLNKVSGASEVIKAKVGTNKAIAKAAGLKPIKKVK